MACTTSYSRPEFSGQKIALGLTYSGGLSNLNVFDQLNLEVRDQMKSDQRMCRLVLVDNLYANVWYLMSDIWDIIYDQCARCNVRLWHH